MCDMQKYRSKKDKKESTNSDIASANVSVAANLSRVSDSPQVQPTSSQKNVAADNQVPYNLGPDSSWQSTISFHELSKEDTETKIERVLDIIKRSMKLKGGETNG